MKAIAITSITLAFAVCTLGATSATSRTPTWADLWAADDAKCRGYGYDPLIDAKAYVDCRAEVGERRGDNRTSGSVEPTVEQVFVEPLNTCSTGRDAGGC